MAVSEEESSSSAANNRSSSKLRSASNGAYFLAKTALRGSVVLQVVSGRLRSPSSYDVVFGKETSIELVTVDVDGIVQSICEQPVFGTIKDLAILPWNENSKKQNSQIRGKDLLVLASDSGKLSFLSFNNEMHRFFPLTHIELSAPGNLRHQVGRMLAVDSSGCFIAACAYEHYFVFLSVSMSEGAGVIDKRSKETSLERAAGNIWSMCFISKENCKATVDHNPVLAVLVNRMRGFTMNELILLEWNMKENAVSVISKFTEPGALAHAIVEVPHSYGFAFLFRVGDVLLMDLRDSHNPCCVYRTSLNFLPSGVETCRLNYVDEEGMFNVAASALLELGDIHKNDDPMNVDSDGGYILPGSNYVCSWTWEQGNENNPRMIFCVDTGDLLMFDFLADSEGLKVNLSDSLYKGQPCNALLWVEGGFVAAIVEMGDGMVLKLEEGRLVYQSPIQNIAPILDMSVVDYHDEKHDQMFACCGVAPEGSLRVIRNGISVEKLLKTAPIYQGITGTWALKMKVIDFCHSFLVLSFVEETRVLSVGVSFTDVTDSVGFLPHVCTLACGLLGNGLLVQIHKDAVRICLPTTVAHPEGMHSSSPICTSWAPENMSISLGAVGHNMIIVATSSPCFLFILGVRILPAYHCEVYTLQRVRLQNELSCISFPQMYFQQKPLADCRLIASLPDGVDIFSTFVIGTHKPSVEVLSFVPQEGLRILAVGTISLTNAIGTAISGCIPQDVKLVLVDRLYVLSGLRNGMLLRFEWPSTPTAGSVISLSQRPHISSLVGISLCSSNVSSQNFSSSSMSSPNIFEKMKDNNPVYLELIAIRRIGITPAFLFPLNDSLDADILVLSDRPWLLQTARHSLSYTSISFQPSTHVTPVCSSECPKGILFVAENSLHLVEMVPSKRLNVQKFHLGGTPRKVLYHNESRLLLVMRTELSNDSYSSDICCIDPLSGSVLSSFKLDPGETGKCMELVKVGNERILVVGTSLSAGPAIMPSGEAESTMGRLIVLCLEHMQNSDSGSMTLNSRCGSLSQRNSPFCEAVGFAEHLSSSSLCSSPDDNSCDGIKLEETEVWHLRLAYSTKWPGMVLAVCPYLDRYFLASAGNAFYVCSFPNDNLQRVRRLAVGRTRFMIMTLTAHFTRIAVGDCRDGILFYSYHEDARKLEQLYCDPVQRLVADCMLMDVSTAVVSDRKGSIAVLSASDNQEDNVSPERNLTFSCSYYMGEIAMSIRKGSFSYKLPADDILRGCNAANRIIDLSHNSVMASTLSGSIVIFIPLSREEYELLESVESSLAVHPLTAPILGNDHNEFRSRENRVGALKMLDGDVLAQFLDLTSVQQEAVLGLPLGSPNTVMLSSKLSSLPINVNQVVQLLERVHYALN